MPIRTLFTYAVVFHPTPVRDLAGNDTTPPSVIIIPPTYIIAASSDEVKMKAAKQIPSEYDSKIDQVAIYIQVTFKCRNLD